MHCWLTLDQKEGDLTLLTQTEDLSLKTNTRRNAQVPSIKSSFLFKLGSLSQCTGTVEPTALRLSDFHFNAPINQFCTC